MVNLLCIYSQLTQSCISLMKVAKIASVILQCCTVCCIGSCNSINIRINMTIFENNSDADYDIAKTLPFLGSVEV